MPAPTFTRAKVVKIKSPYEKYAESIDGFVNWVPFPNSGRSQEIQDLLRSRPGRDNRNDPAAWFAFAVDAVKVSWQALPDDLRREVFAMLNDLIVDAVADLVVDVGDQIGNAVDAIPIIGDIIKIAVQLVYVFVDWARIKRNENEHRTVTNLQNAQFNTIKFMDDPRDWVMQRTRVQNYVKWMGRRTGKGDWTLRPSMRNSLGIDRMFWVDEGKRDSGWCGEGVGMKCPEFWDGAKQYGGCTPHKSGNEAYYCKRDIAISALFYPYWSPAYPPEPIVTYVDDGPDPNALLMARQLALLSNPDANLRVKGRRLRDKSNHFIDYFIHMMKAFGVNDKPGFLEINNDHQAPGTDREDRLLIDEQENPNYSPSKSNMTRFYFRPDGIIEPYSRASGNDPARWGVRTKSGDSGNMALSIDQYNSVVGMTNAFFAARANMLRDGALMKGLKADHGLNKYDEEVRAAISYAAGQGKTLPVYAPLLTKASEYSPKRTLVGPISRSGRVVGLGGGGAGALLGLGVAGAAVYFFMKR